MTTNIMRMRMTTTISTVIGIDVILLSIHPIHPIHSSGVSSVRPFARPRHADIDAFSKASL